MFKERKKKNHFIFKNMVSAIRYEKFNFIEKMQFKMKNLILLKKSKLRGKFENNQSKITK